MRQVTTPTASGFVLRAAALGIALQGLAACSLVAPRVAPPPPSLELVQSNAVELAPECVPTASMQVSFTVERSGETSNIQPSSGPACVQAALADWVRSFRYSPIAASTTGSVEWLLVTAKR
jgi:hypothetical protein